MRKFLKRIRLVFNVKRFLPFLFDFFRSKDVTIRKKALSVLFIIGYIVLPFDLIPDFFAFFGIIDDITILTFVLQQIVKIAPEELKRKHRMDD